METGLGIYKPVDTPQQQPEPDIDQQIDDRFDDLTTRPSCPKSNETSSSSSSNTPTISTNPQYENNNWSIDNAADSNYNGPSSPIIDFATTQPGSVIRLGQPSGTMLAYPPHPRPLPSASYNYSTSGSPYAPPLNYFDQMGTTRDAYNQYFPISSIGTPQYPHYTTAYFAPVSYQTTSVYPPPIAAAYPPYFSRPIDLVDNVTTQSIQEYISLAAQKSFKKSTSTTRRMSSVSSTSSIPSTSTQRKSEHLQCSNCGVRETPAWRRDLQGVALLCNSCGLYLKNKGMMRPTERAADGTVRLKRVHKSSEDLKCSNCGTRSTPCWRGSAAKKLCNKCGLFLKSHGVPRPPTPELRKGISSPQIDHVLDQLGHHYSVPSVAKREATCEIEDRESL